MSNAQNHLIGHLPEEDRERLLAVCVPVQLALSEILCEAGEPTRDVYFPTGGFIALISLVEGHAGVEVGMIGREGMLGAQVALGIAVSPLRAMVQGPGPAWRLSAEDLQQHLIDSPALRHALQRYLYVLMLQQATAAACLRFHVVDQRLARWLLMSQDRARADSFHVTQECLAYMLGVRRVGITEAASELQRQGLIEYRRGDLRVLDRGGLEKAACTCYADDAHTYAAWL